MNFLKRNTKIFELVFEFELFFKVKLAQMVFGRLRTPLMNQHIKKTQIVRIKHVGMTFLDMIRLIKFLERTHVRESLENFSIENFGVNHPQNPIKPTYGNGSESTYYTTIFFSLLSARETKQDSVVHYY